MRTAGIIGGLGPETTSEFYLELVLSCQKMNRVNRPPILICSIPLPYDIEEDAIARGRGEERCIPFILDAAKRLEKAGADFLAMPCNSLHVFLEDIRSSVEIPVLSIVEETAKFLKNERISKVGIVSTSITLNKKLYENSLRANGIRQVAPDGFQQAKIGKMIHNLVMSRHNNKDREELMKIINDFEKKGVRHVILACTDLQLLIPQHPRLKIYDTMKIFADATVNEILKRA
jgi:aspartate racemase